MPQTKVPCREMVRKEEGGSFVQSQSPVLPLPLSPFRQKPRVTLWRQKTLRGRWAVRDMVREAERLCPSP